MRILITGKNGQVGNCLVAKLKEMPEIAFLALDRNELDITNSEQVNQVTTEFKPNVIINAAAYTAVDQAEQEIELAFKVNRDGPYNLAIAAKKCNALIMHVSTDYVFSGVQKEAYTENDPVEPLSVYGRSKLAGEQAVAEACSSHVILRTSWVFSEYGNNFVKTMLRLAKSKKALGIVSDQVGAPTYAGDIADTLITIAKSINSGNKAYGIYHYAGLPYVSWYQFSEVIFEQALVQNLLDSAMGLTAISTEQYPTPAVRPANSKLKCNKIIETFNIQPSNWMYALADIKKYA